MLMAAVDLTVISLKKTLLEWLLVLINHLNLYIRDEGTVCFQVACIGIFQYLLYCLKQICCKTLAYSLQRNGSLFTHAADSSKTFTSDVFVNVKKSRCLRGRWSQRIPPGSLRFLYSSTWKTCRRCVTVSFHSQAASEQNQSF